MDNQLRLSHENFDVEVLKSELPVLVDFWAEWCYPCRLISPVVAEIAAEYAGKIKVRKLNTDENMETAMEYGISGIPTLLLFHKGEIVEQIVGAVPKPQIQKLLDHYLTQLQNQKN